MYATEVHMDAVCQPFTQTANHNPMSFVTRKKWNGYSVAQLIIAYIASVFVL